MVANAEPGFHGSDTYRVDDMSNGMCEHAPLMPDNLARHKPNDHGLSQNIWRDTLSRMGNAEKPFVDIAARIRWHRSIEGLDQLEYAQRAGLKRSQLSNWEAGSGRISIDGALSLRRTYGLSLDFIYEGIDDALPMTLRAALRESPLVNASK